MSVRQSRVKFCVLSVLNVKLSNNFKVEKETSKNTTFIR